MEDSPNTDQRRAQEEDDHDDGKKQDAASLEASGQPTTTDSEKPLASASSATRLDTFAAGYAVNSTKGGNQKTSTEIDYQGKVKAFPFKLHTVLEEAKMCGFEDIASWIQDGKAFKIHNRDRFTKEVLPLYFSQSHYKSFQVGLPDVVVDKERNKEAAHGTYPALPVHSNQCSAS